MKMKKRILAMLICIIYIATVVFGKMTVIKADETTVASQGIVVDGNASEWSAMTSQAVNSEKVESFKITKSADGSVVYLCFEGLVSTEWDTTYLWQNMQVEYASGSTAYLQIANIKDTWVVPGVEMNYSSTANQNNKGVYAVECALPMVEDDYTITFAGVTISAADIPEYVAPAVVIPSYDGIVIDGKYDDWAAVSTTDASCEYHEYECLSETAVVFDGDYVYIYLKDGEDGNASGAGQAANGRYAITTDTGRQITFQVSAANGGSVTGIAGASASYFGNEWEIAIPTSQLPLWNDSIAFGLYMEEPFVSGVMNLQAENGFSGTAGDFSGIVYDGMYGDWNAYPHTLIQYATEGTQTDSPDGEGALYTENGILYGHVISSMLAHLNEEGGEFGSAISICFNGKREYNSDMTWNLYPRLVAVAEDGTIDWNPQLKNLEDGKYEFYIADTREGYGTKSVTNISQLESHEQFFGKLHVTVGEMNDEMEFYIDLEQVAEFLSYHSGTTIEADDFQLIEAQFGRIGQQWLSIAGASSGALGAVATGIAGATVLAWLLKRRRCKVVA